MNTDIFFSSRPSFPWSLYPLGLPALGLVAVVLVLFTVWTYLGHPQASRRRVTIVLALRLAALVIALLTAVRPSVGVQEEPKIPSVLIIVIDESESMTVKDEINGQARIEAVKKTLDRARAALDELGEQNVEVVVYHFSTPDFHPDTSKFDPADKADGKRSDYGTMLNKLLERWQTEKHIRGVIVVGDGQDNGLAFSAVGESARWGRRGVAVHTVVAGGSDTPGDARDIGVVGLACVPGAAPIKTEVELVAEVNAFRFVGATVKARVYLNDVVERTEEVTLTKERGNQVRVKIKAPATPGEVRVRFEIGREEFVDDKSVIKALPGELSELNNATETYLTVTKEGVRVLIIDRLRWDETRLRDVFRGEKRFDTYEVIRQSGLPPTPDEVKMLDVDLQGYDVVIIGNVKIPELPPGLLEKITARVEQKGMGLMFLGGEYAYQGIPPAPPGDPRKRKLEFADLVPVSPSPQSPTPFAIVENVDKNGNRFDWYAFVPTEKGFEDRITRLAPSVADSKKLWDELNNPRAFARLTGYNRFVAKPTAHVYAWGTPAGTTEAGKKPEGNPDPLLVGQTIGVGDRGRILAFAGYDSLLWERLGQPTSKLGSEIHARFWRQCVLYLAHQEDEEGEVYARPEFRRLTAGGNQVVRVGLKAPEGGDDPDAVLTVKVLAPGEFDPADLNGKSVEAAARDEKSSVFRALAKATSRTVERDATGSKITYRPPAAGEFVVVVSTPAYQPGLDGKPERGPDGKYARSPDKTYIGGARFIAVPDVTDEMLKVSSDTAFLSNVAAASGGRSIRLDELPGFLKELKSQPLATLRPRPKFLPDWRRNHSKGFLPIWLVIFTALLGTEWGLRRYWGMV